jgi:hypothetical protein
VFRQKFDQAAGNFPGLTKCSGISGEFRNKPRQLLGRLTVAKRNTVHFTSKMAAVKSIRMMGCDARGRSG